MYINEIFPIDSKCQMGVHWIVHNMIVKVLIASLLEAMQFKCLCGTSSQDQNQTNLK